MVEWSVRKQKSLSAPSKNRQSAIVEGSNDPPALGGKRTRTFGKWFSSKEVSLEPRKSLKQQNSGKLKAEIRRWAKAVTAYARQVSGRLGTSIRSSRIRSSSSHSSSSSPSM